MLGLILIYFVGKVFYNLAEQHGKSPWLFAILGVGSYYLGIFIGGVVIVLLYEVVLLKSIDDVDDMLLSIVSIPIGVLGCWLFYLILDRVWSKQPSIPPSSEEILDADLLNNNRGAANWNTDKKE